jgi:segregation and condensation protein B
MKLIDSVHALLFAADSPSDPEQLAASLECPAYEVEEALDKLGERLSQGGPVQLVRIAGGYQLCTKPEFAQIVAKYIQPQQSKLSRSLMEVLAIVAYKQPVTMAEIDAVRGVQSDYSLRQLLEKRLISDVGRKPTPGRPILYATTQQFLHLFNLDTLTELPDVDLEELEIQALIKKEEEVENTDQPTLEPLPSGESGG